MSRRPLVSGGGGGGISPNIGGSELPANDGDNITDAIEAIIGDDVHVILPAGTFYIDRPIRLTQNTVVSGQGRGLTNIVPTYWSGPAFIMSKIRDPIPHGPSLVTGDDYSLRFTYDSPVDGQRWLNLSRAGLNPKEMTAFSLEFWMAPHTAIEDDANCIFICIGSRDANDTTPTFGLSIVTGGFTVNGTIGGAYFQFGGAMAWAVDVANHVVIDYDGSTVRIFVDGDLKGSAAASGEFTSPTYHDFVLGHCHSFPWPDGAPYVRSQNVDVGSFRFSSVSRRVANFTPPTTVFTPDTNDRMVFLALDENEWDEFYQVGVEGTNQLGWVQTRREGTSTSSDCAVLDLTVLGPGNIRGIIGVDAYGMIRPRVSVDTVQCLIGIELWNDSRFGVIDTPYITGGEIFGSRSSIGVGIIKASGGAIVYNPYTQGHEYGVVVQQSDAEIIGGYSVENWNVPLLLQQTRGGNYIGMRISDEQEAAYTAEQEYGVLFISAAGVTYLTNLSGINVEAEQASTIVPIGIQQTELTGTTINLDARVYVHANTAEVVKFLNTDPQTIAPIVVDRLVVAGGPVPVSNYPQLVRRPDGEPQVTFSGTTDDDTPVTSLGGVAMELVLRDDTVNKFTVCVQGTNLLGELLWREVRFVIDQLGGTATATGADIDLSEPLTPSAWDFSHSEAGDTVTFEITGDALQEVEWEVKVYWEDQVRMGGSLEWTPLGLPGVLWGWEASNVLDATDVAPVDAEAVKTLVDITGGGQNFAQATAGLRGLFDAADPAANNQPGVIFDAGDDFYDFAGSILTSTGAESWVLTVSKDLAGNGGALFTSRSTGRYVSAMTLTIGADTYVSGNGVDAGANQYIDEIGTEIQSVNYTIHQHNGSGDEVDFYLDGTLHAITSVGTAQVTEDGAAGALIGKNAQGQKFQGTMYAQYVGMGTLSAGDRANIAAWVAKFGL